MKSLFFILALVFCLAVNAQEVVTTNNPTDTSSTYLVKLIDNTSLTGKILERSATEILFQDITIGKVSIPTIKILKLTELTGEQLCILTTNDGKTFSGILVSQDENDVKLKTRTNC